MASALLASVFESFCASAIRFASSWGDGAAILGGMEVSEILRCGSEENKYWMEVERSVVPGAEELQECCREGRE